jgi:hypothetical protein
MTEMKVWMQTGVMPVSREENGTIFSVHNDDGVLMGELVVSKGGIRWRRNGQTERTRRLVRWNQLEPMIAGAK